MRPFGGFIPGEFLGAGPMSFRIVACVVLATLSVAGCGMFGGSKSDSGDTKTVQTTSNPYGTDPGKIDPKDFNPRIQPDKDPSTPTLISALLRGLRGWQNHSRAAGRRP